MSSYLRHCLHDVCHYHRPPHMGACHLTHPDGSHWTLGWCTSLPLMEMYMIGGSVRVSRQKFIYTRGSHTCSLETSMRATIGIPRGGSLLLPVSTVNCIQTLQNLPQRSCFPYGARFSSMYHGFIHVRVSASGCGCAWCSGVHPGFCRVRVSTPCRGGV
jgi:hypothetical protein